MKRILIAVCAAIACAQAFTQQTVTAGQYMIQVTTRDKLVVGQKASIDVFIMDGRTMAPIMGLVVSGKLGMPSMPGMDVPEPGIKPGDKPGHYAVDVTLPMGGEYTLTLTIKSSAGNTVTTKIDLKAGMQHAHESNTHDMHEANGMHMMAGMLGPWPMNREGSGTSWQPDSSPMYMKMLPKVGRYDLNLMGELQTGYIDAGGKRGDKQGYANSMIMWMANRETAGGALGLRLMVSADPITNGKHGVPNLFQTGETLNGQPLVDRQHPHDLISELAVSFSKPIAGNTRAFLYAGPVGEPALGNVMFMHRPSGMEIPEAPISHHWFDSTHISFGVATIGVTFHDKWKLEGSVFNGHEPNENRFDIDPIQFNSASGRVSFNPDPNWSLSASYGFLKSPEELEPGANQHRVTASASYNRTSANGDNWATTALFGKNIRAGAQDSNAFLLESTYTKGSTSLFGRFERVDKDELVGVPAGSYKVNKALLGVTHDIAKRDGFDYGIGAYIGVYGFPKTLKPFYGSHPTTFGLFLRIRPSKM